MHITQVTLHNSIGYVFHMHTFLTPWRDSNPDLRHAAKSREADKSVEQVPM
jgi:hypothetical protein